MVQSMPSASEGRHVFFYAPIPFEMFPSAPVQPIGHHINTCCNTSAGGLKACLVLCPSTVS